MKPDRKVAPRPPSLSVIVPVHQMTGDFSRCLGAIAQMDPPPLELIVVVDGGCRKAVDAADVAGAIVTQTQTRRGPAAARNLGARSARGEVLFFVDADVVVPKDAVRKLQSYFTGAHGPDAVVGSYDDTPKEPNFLSQYKNLLQHYVHQTARDPMCTFWGACGAIRRNAFFAVGGFDERYTEPSIEDIELGYRLRDGGYSIRMARALQVTHLKRWSAHTLFVSDFFRRAIPWSRLILSTGRMDNVLNIQRMERLKVGALHLAVLQLLLSPLSSSLLLSAAATALVLVVADAKLLRFYQSKRGLLFATRALAWHWLYYAYSGMAFGITALSRRWGRWLKRPEEAWTPDWNRALYSAGPVYGHASPHRGERGSGEG